MMFKKRSSKSTDQLASSWTYLLLVLLLISLLLPDVSAHRSHGSHSRGRKSRGKHHSSSIAHHNSATTHRSHVTHHRSHVTPHRSPVITRRRYVAPHHSSASTGRKSVNTHRGYVAPHRSSATTGRKSANTHRGYVAPHRSSATTGRKSATTHSRGGSDMKQRLVPQTRLYEVAAIPMPIVMNSWGDFDANGAMFALKENLEHLSNYRDNILGLLSQNSSALPMDPLVKPLVLRCNQGDKLHVKFTNNIQGREVGMHPYLYGYDIKSDGTAVGSNPTSLLNSGQVIEYTWPCLKEGTYLISDGGSYDGSPAGTVVHGLFGAIIVEPRGSLWTDPTTGKPTVDGIHVDIHPYPLNGGCPKRHDFYAEEDQHSHPDCPFREFTLFFQDRVAIQNNRAPTIDPCTGANTTGTPIVNIFNYRSEPMKNRELALWRMIREGKVTNVNGEEQHHSSWLFGDPATPVFRAYAGDPVRFRVVETGVTETHK
ncbi:hypothetical protein K7432_017654 [Basidiobolus ranarum]|uniref:Uncharacterized protein n=1 Tax=Basidiobolus ranarum TaxID=34480 RepID=A0ABR2WD29_9FUNG